MKEKMHWVCDLDGCITSNPDFFKWWIFTLRKKENSHSIDILTARNPIRREETRTELEFWGIKYDNCYFMPHQSDRSLKAQALWKLEMINKIKPDVWIDNDFKIYQSVLGIDLDEQTLGVKRILI